MTHNVLVYGTLRPGNSRKVEVPATMFDLGAFPGIRLGGPDTVTCELVTVDDATLSRLDSYEGYHEDAPEHSLYIRQRYEDPSAGVSAWIYEYNDPEISRHTVEGGDWLEYIGKPRGTAAYFLESA